jgi:hypothetical protein
LRVKTVSYEHTRFVFQRAMAFIYLIAFLGAAFQIKALVGENGLLPARLFVERVSFQQSPSLFYFWPDDFSLVFFAWLGVGVSVFVLSGWSERFGLALSSAAWFFIWVVYLSFVNIGQTFYAFGWETMLLETGFLMIFLGSKNDYAPPILFWLHRWVIFRVMFGAGLIKLRGDACWRDLSCLTYHYQTQPIPNPLSWYYHHAPLWFHQAGVLFNHFVELIVPLGLFFSGPIAWIAGAWTILFQIILLSSGNLSFLNYLTIAMCIPCLDDRIFRKIFKMRESCGVKPLKGPRIYLITGLAVMILTLSIQPALNLLSRNQVMNRSYDPLHIRDVRRRHKNAI